MLGALTTAGGRHARLALSGGIRTHAATGRLSCSAATAAPSTAAVWTAKRQQ